MKKLIMLISLVLISQAIFCQNKLSIDPLFKLGIYTNKSLKIYDPNEKWSKPYRFDTGRNIDYNIHAGFRVSYNNFSFESENIFYIATDNFTSNYPYSTHFFIRGYYTWKKFKIGYEHLCIHPVISDVNLEYQMIGEYDEFYISINL